MNMISSVHQHQQHSLQVRCRSLGLALVLIPFLFMLGGLLTPTILAQDATPQPSGDATMSAPTSITGTIVFPDDLPAGPTATITVRLEDVSLADAPATIISSVTVPGVMIPPAAGVPVTFSLPVESFDPRARYTVRAHVDRDGDGQVSKGDLISTSHIPVLTHGGGADVQIPVELV